MSRRGIVQLERKGEGEFVIHFPEDRPVRATDYLFSVTMFNEDEPRMAQFLGEGGTEICLLLFDVEGNLRDGDFQLVAEHV